MNLYQFISSFCRQAAKIDRNIHFVGIVVWKFESLAQWVTFLSNCRIEVFPWLDVAQTAAHWSAA